MGQQHATMSKLFLVGLVACCALVEPTASLAPTSFDTAVQDLLSNPSDDYLGLDEDERQEPQPVTQISLASPLRRVPDVEIQPEVTYKYVLLQAKDGLETKYIIRGSSQFDLHADNYEAAAGGGIAACETFDSRRWQNQQGAEQDQGVRLLGYVWPMRKLQQNHSRIIEET